jgi:hypothetical protein
MASMVGPRIGVSHERTMRSGLGFDLNHLAEEPVAILSYPGQSLKLRGAPRG